MAELNFLSKENLSIRLGADGFSFLHSAQGQDKLVRYRTDASISLAANLCNAVDEMDIDPQAYRKISISIAEGGFTCYPLSLLDDKHAEEVYYYNHPQSLNQTVCVDTSHTHDVVVIYATENSLTEAVRHLLPSATMRCIATPMIDYLSPLSRQGNTSKLYCMAEDKALFLWAFNRGQLLLCNRVDCHNTSNRVYHMLHAWHSLHLDQQTDELHLLGSLPERGLLTDELKRFVQHVYIMPDHTAQDLHALNTCT